MTAVADREIAAKGGYYEIQFPETGEILGYLTVDGASSRDGLGEALRQNGLRLVPAALQQQAEAEVGFLP